MVDIVKKVVNFIWTRALNHRQFTALLEESESDLCYHTSIRWLSLAKVLYRVWDLKTEIWEFCQMKGKDVPELTNVD